MLLQRAKARCRRYLLSGESAPHGIPGEGGTPDAVGGLDDALEGGELAKLFVLLRAHHLEEGFDLLLRLLAALARELLCEHRGRRLRDGASATGKAHLFEAAIVHLRVDCHHVAAERIIYVFVDVGILQLAPVARMLEVVEQDLSVEALHHRAGILSGARVRVPACGYHAPPP